jgi:manganese oxidase
MTIDRNPARRTRLPAGDLLVALAMGLAGSGWLAWLATVGQGRAQSLDSLLRSALTIAVFALPPVLVAVPVTLNALRRDHSDVARSSALAGLVCAPLAAAAMSAGNQLRLGLFGQAPPGLPVLTMVGDALSLLVILLPVAWLALALRRLPSRRRLSHTRSRARAGLAMGLGIAVAMSTAAFMPTTAAGAPSATASACLDSGPADKSFDVTALDVDIPINRFGDHDPLGKMYALTSRVPDVRAQETSQTVSIGLRDDAIQPLVIRANEGDCVEIRFANTASGGDFGMHIDGLEFNASSSGDSIGANPSSAVGQGQSTTYRFAIPLDARLEGGHYLHPGPGYRGAVNHGLFGSLVVEPPGSTYWNPSTPSQPLASGWEAIIKPMGVSATCTPTTRARNCAFREAALLHHEIGNDNEVLKNKQGADLPLVDDTTGSYRPGAFALNYRSEPFRNRLLAFPKEKAHAYSSVTFGDPATPMMRGYLADPTKIRLMHVGAEKFHVFHLHGGGDRWRYNPVADPTGNYADTGLKKDPATALSPSQRLDSQSIGPGETYNLEIEGGAGGVQQSSGDFLYHCHIAKHYVSGMWSVWRVYNTRQPDLVPLIDRVAPPAAVESSALIGRTINGTTITAASLDDWIRPQLPPSGVPRDSQDATVWNWRVAGTAAAPRYLGAPADPTIVPGSPQVVPGQPNLFAVDVGHIEAGRPAILFNPLNGRPAYPMLRPNIGKRPPFTGGGHGGAPWLGANAAQPAKSSADPWAQRSDGLCPTGRKLRKFNVVAIGKPIPRTPTFTDPEGKIFVLAKNKTATYADPAKSDPLAIRANQGDCIGITLTNEIPDASAFDNFSKATMHIHHVQFDVQGSDGVTAGFAYEHSVRPYKVEDPTLLAPASAGDTVLRLSDVSKFVGTDANGQATRPWLAVGQGLETIDIQQIASVNVAAKTVTLTSGLDSDHAAAEFAGTEFVQYRWYPDAVLDNIFWHDHVDGIHGWGHGLVGQLIIEPAGSTYHDPVTGDEVDSGTLVDIHTPTALSPGLVKGSFRELALWTINDNDKGDYSTMNLKANPLADRPDKANQFSSWMYGDPVTPLPRLYPNDPLVIRTISISPTVDTLHLQGGRTLLEPRYTHPNATGAEVPEGTIIDAIHSGISEKYTLVFNGEQPDLKMRPGDYLYANGNETRTQQGAWGIVRILPGTVDSLKPLPGVTEPAGNYVQPVTTASPPPASTSPGNPCPPGAPARNFGLSALDRSGGLNGARTAYVPNADVAAIQKRLKAPVPLVLHAVAGECVTVDLTNLLTTPVGFSVGKLDREAGSGGVNVGFAAEQNVTPGATRQYVYYAPTDRVGTVAIADLAGGTTLKQGLYGALVVAPASTVPGEPTEFRSPTNGAPKDIGAQVLVHVPGATTRDYRDFTVMMADDDAKIGQDFMPYPTSATAGRSLINYQAAPAGDGPTAFRDPGNVPWLTAYAGDPMEVHVLTAPGSESPHVFSLGGLRWDQDSHVDYSNSLTAQGMGPWETFNAKVTGGAGGTQQAPGDYFYGDQRRPFTQVGLWGLQRVLPVGTGECPIRLVNGSTCATSQPGAPTIGTATPGNASAVVRWTAPANAGTAGVTGYSVRVVNEATGAQVGALRPAAADATSLTVTGLVNGTTVTFQVRAANTLATGVFSGASEPVTPAAAPGAPLAGAVTAGNASALVRWTAPASDGGSAITRYSVRVVNAATLAQVGALRPAAAGATSLTVTGLVNGTAVRFQVQASNALATGAYSGLSSVVTPATLPGAPLIGAANPGTLGGTITARANWTPPASNGGLAVNGYVVTALRMSAGGAVLGQTSSAVQPATARSLTMTLAAGSYRFTVRARNGLGLGIASARSQLVAAR